MFRFLPHVTLSISLLVSAGCSEAPSTPAETDQQDKDTTESISTMQPDPNRLEIQGHRGARGLLPENTVPGFVLALREGADVLEMDLCIARDESIMVSHEPWMSHEICRTPNGVDINAAGERKHNLHAMTKAEIQAYDCGSRIHPRFPNQQNLPVQKPTLSDVVKVAETVPLLDGGAVRYNLEIKYRPDLEPEFCPDAETFASLVLEELNRLGIANRSCIQSFSPEVMEAVHRMAPNMTLAWLTETPGSVETQLNRLTFEPDIYSPDWHLIDASDVYNLQKMGIRVIPWTVNSQEDLYTVMQMGVDGIITDFPDRLYAMR